MLKMTRTYKDFDGNDRTVDLYFNLTKAEIMEMQLSTNGGLDKMIQSIVAAQDAAEIVRLFKTIILKSYGQKSPDGNRFIKSQELRDEFEQTNAYSDLFMELATDSEKAAAFINAVVPKSLAEEADKLVDQK